MRKRCSFFKNLFKQYDLSGIESRDAKQGAMLVLGAFFTQQPKPTGVDHV